VLRNYIPIDSIDSVVIDKAQELNSILVSLNGDFSDIITYPPAKYKGIVSLKVRNHPEDFPLIIEKLLNFLSNHPDVNYFKGKLFLVEVHRIRIRK
jgi:predicted nuclease of predicted toxin-antitoxin system